MITATANTEPVRQQRRPDRKVPRQLARYLARHAGPLPKAAPRSRASGALEAQALAGARNPTEQRALRELYRIWGATRGYFPGKEMPVPRFGGNRAFDEGAVGYAQNPRGDPVAVGVQFGRNTMEMLTRPQNQRERDEAMQTVLHEWAHNFQRPELHRSQAQVDPVREGGAEGFAHAAAPGIARALGQRYVGRGGIAGAAAEYRPYVARLLRQHGPGYFTRGQFR